LGVAVVQRTHGRDQRERAGDAGPGRGQLGPGADELGHRGRLGFGSRAVTAPGGGVVAACTRGAGTGDSASARTSTSGAAWLGVIRPAASARPAVSRAIAA